MQSEGRHSQTVALLVQGSWRMGIVNMETQVATADSGRVAASSLEGKGMTEYRSLVTLRSAAVNREMASHIAATAAAVVAPSFKLSFDRPFL